MTIQQLIKRITEISSETGIHEQEIINGLLAHLDIKYDDNLAFRIQIEIDIDNRNKANFLRCVEGINRTRSSYHKLIEKVL